MQLAGLVGDVIAQMNKGIILNPRGLCNFPALRKIASFSDMMKQSALKPFANKSTINI
jgi:hypothetical protein